MGEPLQDGSLIFQNDVYIQLMKHIRKLILLLLLVIIFPFTSHAQWQFSGQGGNTIYIFTSVSNTLYTAGYDDLLSPQISRTTDNGFSWTGLQAALPLNGEVRSFAITQNGLMAFVSTQQTGVYKTTNDGVNWTRLTNLPSTVTSIMLFTSTNRDTVYAGTFGSGTLYRTTNEGQTWDSTGKLLAGPNGYSSLNLALLKDGVFYCAKDSGLYRSADEGATWTKTGTIAQGAGILNILASDSTIYACGGSTQDSVFVYRSTNKGINWSFVPSRLSYQQYGNKTCFTAFGNLLFVTTGTSSTPLIAKVLVSANFGASWQDLSEGIPSNLPFPLSLTVKDSIVFASFGAANGVWKRSIVGLYAAVPKSPDRNASTFSLSQNYPNPFNPTTVISYQLVGSSQVSLKVYDVLGREVATLVNEHKAAGSYEARFDAGKLASGIYFYKLQAGSFVQAKKMLLVK
jgi:photosystem II stability/assembly factor-like uncharacterized protein